MTSTKEEHMADQDRSDTFDLIDLVAVLIRRRRLLVFVVCLTTAASVASALMRDDPGTYVAEANAVMTANRQIRPDNARLERTKVNFAVLRNASVGLKVLEREVPYLRDGKPDSIRLWDYIGRTGTTRSALDALFKVVTFERNAYGILTFKAEMADSLVATATVNAFLESLIEYYTDIERDQAQKDLDFLIKRAETVAQDLRVAEDSLHAFKARHLGKLNELTAVDQLAREYSRRQHLVTTRDGIYRNVMAEQERVRIGVDNSRPQLDVLSFAKAHNVKLERRSIGQSAAIGIGVGIVLGLTLCIVLESIGRLRKRGDLSRLTAAFRGDS